MPSSIRLLRMLNHPNAREKNETASSLEELEESDVVWSSSGFTSGSSAGATAFEATRSAASPSQSNAGAGISAASNQIRSPVVQRSKTAINPLLSAVGVAAISTAVAPPAPSSITLSKSAPVKVPTWPQNRWIGRGNRGVSPMGPFEEEEEELDDDEEMVPPHEIVARSHRTTTFSVVEGAGRTLKGRDLSTVRNAVMQKTGFLD